MPQHQREWILFVKWKHQFHVAAFGLYQKEKEKKEAFKLVYFQKPIM